MVTWRYRTWQASGRKPDLDLQTRRAYAPTLAVVILLFAAPGWAQQKQAEQPDRVRVTGRLTNDDPIHPLRAGCRFKQFDVSLKAGVPYSIDLKSGDFDAYLRVEDARGGLLAEDDDSGGGQNARIYFRPPASATYRVIATTFTPGTGRFTLTVMPRSSNIVSVSVVSPFLTNAPTGQQEDTHGYVEYWFAVHNESADVGHRATLEIPHRNDIHRSGYYLRWIKRSVQLGPGESQEIGIWQPNLPTIFGNSQMGLLVDGRPSPLRFNIPLQPERGSRSQNIQVPTNLFTRSILAPESLFPVLTSRVFLSAVGQPGASGPVPFVVMSGQHDGKPYTYVQLDRFRGAQGAMDKWSRHWLGYSSFDGIVLPARDLRAAPAEVRSALWQYVECGGALVIIGAADLPPHWQHTRREHDGLTSYYPGFGECIIVPADKKLPPADDIQQNWGPGRWHALTATWARTGLPFRAVTSPSGAQERFAVVDDVSIPVRDLFLVMIVFCVLIGPLNILVLFWMGRRIWLLWTVPAFSLLTCAAVVGFMSATEDWHGTVRTEGLTILDESAGRATSIGWLGLYSPQTPGDGLYFSRDTELSPHNREARWGSHPAFTIDWTDDRQHLTSGWLTARIPSHFLVRTTEERREHLAVKAQPDGSLTIDNALGTDIATIWIADAHGTIYAASAIPAGAAGTAKRTPQRAAAIPSKLREAFDSDWLELVDRLAAAPEAYLRPGCYIAVLDAAPFMPPGLEGATPRGCRSVVYGIRQTR